ncbi:hypothetical protein Q7C36_018011 [Tachysurus vachellii]|uniref:Uncharacterized protein n=1 Tax=Tachysurus vachellii TaxID=175792 RepID=A0AA88LYZ1_TACVA|nr:hypothetical protein Q7C36_018011 [Tachysurus vachellii]
MNGLQYSCPVLANRKLEMRHCSTPKLKAKQCNGWGWHGNQRKWEDGSSAFGNGEVGGKLGGQLKSSVSFELSSCTESKESFTTSQRSSSFISRPPFTVTMETVGQLTVEKCSNGT